MSTPNTPASGFLGAHPTQPSHPRLRWLRRNIEVTTAIFLGVVSVITAYASFQSALYDSSMTGNYTQGQALITEANALYLEGSQQYAQDLQTWNRLNELGIDMESSDPELAAAADVKFSTIFTNSVSDELSAAIAWSDDQNTSNPDDYFSPVDSEDYVNSIYADAQASETKGYTTIEKGNEDNTLSDRMTLNTVLYAIVLFLLGIGAVVQEFRIKVLLGSVSVVIFVVAAALTVIIPFKGI
jgi:hypothetical protein